MIESLQILHIPVNDPYLQVIQAAPKTQAALFASVNRIYRERVELLYLPLPWHIYHVRVWCTPHSSRSSYTAHVRALFFLKDSAYDKELNRDYYRTPLPNSYNNGRVCAAATDFVVAASRDKAIERAITAFWNGVFKYHDEVGEEHQWLQKKSRCSDLYNIKHYKHWQKMKQEEVLSLPWSTTPIRRTGGV